MRADRTSTQDVAGYAVARAADGAGTAQGHARLTARAARRDDDTTPGPWPLLGVVAYLVMVGMNGLANALPLFGNSTAEVSRRYPTLFTPAPFTFAVWGVIYLLLGAFAVYQALPAQRGDPRLARVRPLFVLSCLLNVGWLVAWHADRIAVSEVVMLALLGTLVAVGVRLDARRAPASRTQRWLVDAPFSVYLGWISVATIANTAIFLVSQGVDGGRYAVAVTVAVVAAAGALGLAATLTRRDAAYALVVGWGLVGVAAARAGESGTVSVTAAVSAGLLAVAAAWALGNRLRRSPDVRA